MATNHFNSDLRRVISSMDFKHKVDNLYKFLSQGWSIAISESKAGLRPSMKDYSVYKSSEHYERVRTMYAKHRR